MADISGDRARSSDVALTGTPGTGKSSVGRVLGSRFEVIEVAELAREFGAVTGRGPHLTVDISRMRLRWRRRSTGSRALVVVGHLAHLLPIRDAIVLRCHPLELPKRLGRAGRGTATERWENAAAEAVDRILIEALSRRRRVWEVDTTDRRVSAVAREVASLIRTRPPSRCGGTDWLADPTVTAHLLRHRP